jgi:hypothetical protein
MKLNITIALFLLTTNLFAQSKEEKQLFKTFVAVCNSYKQFPLQLTVDYKKESNFPLSEADSKVQEGLFCFQKGAGYIKFGELEQVVTDSLVLMIMSSIKHMVLSENNKELGAQLSNMMNVPLNDSSITTLSKKYAITQKIIDKTTTQLFITAKQKLNSTELPLEEIMLLYNSKNLDPQSIETIKRGLVKKEKIGDAKIIATTVTIPQKGDYLVKEDKSIFVYKTITHSEKYILPVLLSDRIEKNNTDGYVPVKAFEKYKLTIN